MMVARGAETRLGHPFRTLHERPLRGIAGSHAHGPFPGVGHNTVIRGISSLRLFSIPANAGANTVFAKSSNVVDDVLVFERGSALDAPGADASLSRSISMYRSAAFADRPGTLDRPASQAAHRLHARRAA